MADVEVQFGAKIDELDRGVATAKSRLDDMQKQVEGMASSFSVLGSSIRDAISQAEDSISELGDTFKALNDTIQKGGAAASTSWIKILLGGGAIGAAAAGLVGLLQKVGDEFIDLERNAKEATISLERFQELKFALNVTGASDEKLTSGLQEASKKLNELSHDSGELGKFLDANNVKWKDAAGHIIDMNRYIEISAQLIRNATTEGDKFKAGELLGFSREWVRVLQDGPVALRQSADEAHKIGAVLNEEMIHKAADFEKEWKKSTTVWAEWFKSTIVSLTPYVQKLVDWLGVAVGYVAKIAVDLGKAISEDFKEGLAPSKSMFDADFGAFADTGMSRMREFLGISNQVGVAWQKAADEAKLLSNDVERAAGQTFPSKGTVFPDKDDKGKSSAAIKDIDAQIDAWRFYYEKLKIFETSEVASFRESEGQKVTNLRQALAEREANVKVLYEKEIGLAGDSAEKVAEIRRRMNREIETIDRERFQLEAEQLRRSVKEWESLLGSVTGAFNSQLRGLLSGTVTWAQAMKNIVGDLVIKIIEKFEELAIVKPLTSILASTMTAPTELFAGLVKVVSGMFGPLMAGFTSFFAPTLGPAAPAAGAAAAGAEVAAATAAVGSFEFGTDFVPQTGLALVHRGERITPAAKNFGDGPQASFSFNIQAIDSMGVQAFFNRFGPQISRMLASHMDQNPSFQQG